MVDIRLIRILYMEDDPGLSRLLQKSLQRRGYAVDLAMNGEDGLAMLEKGPYDLLLLDYNMPFCGGIDVIRALSSKDKLPPTIMVTGEGNEQIAVEALKLGASDYVVKDTEMRYLELLPVVIEQVLSKQQLIREKQRMFEALRESEERLRLLVESTEDLIIMQDADGRYLYYNGSPRFGITQAEVVGKTPADFFEPAIAAKLADRVRRVASAGQRLSEEWQLTWRGESLWLLDELYPVKDDRGKISAVVTISRNISARKKMEEDLLRAQKLESLGVLAGGLAHDFNNLLTAVLGNISLAKLDSPAGGPVAKRLEEAEKASQRAQKLTQQLLTFSRGGAPVKKALSLAELAKDAAEFALRGSRARCEFFIPDVLWRVEADEGQITQVISNLVMNADQAMPGGGAISITVENIVVGPNDALPLAQGNYVKLSVRDEGAGIPEEHMKKVFDPYFTTKQRGSGLGLATSYSIISRHGGYITLESEVGKGSTFYVFLPAMARETGETTFEEDKPVPGMGRILIMDDEEMIRDVAGKMLRNAGYEVECARDGDETVHLYKRAQDAGTPFDAVIMDLTIRGGMGGKEAIKKLRKIDPGVKAIVSSGYSNEPVMAEYEKYGFSGVVSKPYTTGKLNETVRSVIKR